jgi:hypothetical protein
LVSNNYERTIAIAREAEELERECDPQLHAAALDALGFALYHRVMTGGVGEFDDAARRLSRRWRCGRMATILTRWPSPCFTSG